MEFNIGDIVRVKFKPEELNPYIIKDITFVSLRGNYHSGKLYTVGRNGSNMGFTVEESEIELHLTELRDRKLIKLGL
jgi:hypothetical protein